LLRTALRDSALSRFLIDKIAGWFSSGYSLDRATIGADFFSGALGTQNKSWFFANACVENSAAVAYKIILSAPPGYPGLRFACFTRLQPQSKTGQRSEAKPSGGVSAANVSSVVPRTSRSAGLQPVALYRAREMREKSTTRPSSYGAPVSHTNKHPARAKTRHHHPLPAAHQTKKFPYAAALEQNDCIPRFCEQRLW
jgi:hypothetical protein